MISYWDYLMQQIASWHISPTILLPIIGMLVIGGTAFLAVYWFYLVIEKSLWWIPAIIIPLTWFFLGFNFVNWLGVEVWHVLER